MNFFLNFISKENYMILTIFSYIGIFVCGVAVGMAMTAILAANHRDPRSDEEQLEFLRKYKEKNNGINNL